MNLRFLPIGFIYKAKKHLNHAITLTKAPIKGLKWVKSGQFFNLLHFVFVLGFVMGCPQNIVNGQGLKDSTAKHSS